ncbi:MAG: four helix bundle protein [Acidobacteriaceae bacterium]
MAGSYKGLRVWQESFALSVAVDKLTRAFPPEELYGLTSQIRRAAVSIPSNIAEGYGRGTRRDYRSFISIARGSVLELQTQLAIAGELGFGQADLMENVRAHAEEVGKMLGGLIGSGALSPVPGALEL